MPGQLLSLAAPMTQGARDIRGLLPRLSAGTFSQQVADYVAAEDEKKRQLDEEKNSLLSRAALNFTLGAGIGGIVGGIKAVPFTREAWNPSTVATTAALGGAAALAFTLARSAFGKRLSQEATATIQRTPQAAAFVARHPSTIQKARELEFARWAPLTGLELGALVGGAGSLLGRWVLGREATPSSQAWAAGIGAVVGGVAGLGLGYLYRRKKRRDFLEHVEQEMRSLPSASAQEASIQSEVEGNMRKAAAVVRKKKRPADKSVWAPIVAGAGAVSALGALALVPPTSYKNISDFSDEAKRWASGEYDPREMNKRYAILGAKALQGGFFSPAKAIELYRKSPISSTPWHPSSGRHYQEFERGPLNAYLQLAHEVSDERDTSDTAMSFRAGIAGVRAAGTEYLETGGLTYPDWLVPGILNERDAGRYRAATGKSPTPGGEQRMRDNLARIFEEVRPYVDTSSRVNLFGRRRTEVSLPSFSPAEAEPELQKGFLYVAKRLYGDDVQDLSKLTQNQQDEVLNRADAILKQDNPKLWVKKQVFDTGLGLSRYAARDYYPKYIDPARTARNVALYGGLAALALGGGYMLHQWLSSKDDKEEEAADKVIKFPRQRLEKAADSMVKDAVDGIRRPPLVSTNAGLLRGASIDRYAAGKFGAKKVYAQALGDVRSFFNKAAEDDVLERQNDGDDFPNKDIAKVYEELYPTMREQPAPSSEIVEQAAPSTHIDPQHMKTADTVSLIPRREVLYFTPSGNLAVKRGDGRRFDLPIDVEGAKPVPYELPVALIPESGVPEKGFHGYNITLQSAEGDLPDGYEEIPPEAALKELYAALGKPENKPFTPLDRARARAILRIMKKRTPQAA